MRASEDKESVYSSLLHDVSLCLSVSVSLSLSLSLFPSLSFNPTCGKHANVHHDRSSTWQGFQRAPGSNRSTWVRSRCLEGRAQNKDDQLWIRQVRPTYYKQERPTSVNEKTAPQTVGGRTYTQREKQHQRETRGGSPSSGLGRNYSSRPAKVRQSKTQIESRCHVPPPPQRVSSEKLTVGAEAAVGRDVLERVALRGKSPRKDATAAGRRSGAPGRVGSTRLMFD